MVHELMKLFARHTISARFAVLLFLLLSPLCVSAYDGKTYMALSGGIARLDYDVARYRQLDSTDEAYELSAGWDISNRFSLEMSWSDLGEFDYRRIDEPNRSNEQISLVSYRINGVFYLFSSNGIAGLRERTGFSGFLKIGAGRTENREFFSDLGDELDDTYGSLGLGFELGLNRSTYFRFQVQSFDEDLVYSSAAIMWRWGRQAGY